MPSAPHKTVPKTASDESDTVHEKKHFISFDWRERALHIAEVAKTASYFSNPHVLVRYLYKALSEALSCDAISIYVMDAYGRQMVECASLMDMNALSTGGVARMPKDLGRCETIMSDKMPETVDQLHPRIDDYIVDSLVEDGYLMLLVSPLVVGSESIGVFCAMFEEMLSLTAEDLDYALMLGDVVGSIVGGVDWRAHWALGPIGSVSSQEALFTKPTIGGSTQETRVMLQAQRQRLTDRDLEVMELIADGLSNQEIAETLFLSNGTVKKYVANLMQKIGAQNRVQIAAYAIERRFLDGRMFQ